MKSTKLVWVGLLCGLAGFFAARWTWKDSANQQSSTAPAPISVPFGSRQAYAALLGYDPSQTSQLVERAVQSVVNISAIRIVQYRTFSPFLNDPFFEHFFGGSQGPFGIPRERREQSLGSGVVISADGHILTNHHVVQNAGEIAVRLDDGTELSAKVIGTDPPTDVALLKIDTNRKLTPLTMGDSDSLGLAELVFAIGSPFGLGGTVTMGIVSAKGRANVGIVDYEDFIQTDAAINPGNSGGALINLRGELIGINTAIYSRSGVYHGIGFAIPINMAKYVMDQLLSAGAVKRGWLGVHYQDVSADIAKALQLTSAQGVIVTGVYHNSPAAAADIKPGDLLLTYNGSTIRNAGHLSKLLSETPINKEVTLERQRDGKNRKLTLRLTEVPQQLKAPRSRQR